MRAIFLCTVLLSISLFSVAEQLPRTGEERIQEIEKETYNVIDQMFARARMSAVNKENMMSFAWFDHPHISSIQNLLSDARIESSFDPIVLRALAERMDVYLHAKIRDEFENVITQGSDAVGVRQYLVIAKILCDLSEGADCRNLMRDIEHNNSHIIADLEKEREAQEAEELLILEKFVLGMRQKD